MVFSAVVKKASRVGAFFVSALLAAELAAQCPAPGATQAVRVTRVVDGDTLHLADGRKARLIGLNAPELGRRGQAAQPFAEQARAQLQALLAQADGRIDIHPPRPQRDRYGRILVHAFDATGNLEARLLGEGLGYFVSFAPASPLAPCQAEAERRAREAGLGVWRRPQWLDPAEVRSAGFALVRGRISAVERNGGGFWLELGENLVLRLRPQRLQGADQARLSDLLGRQVEVRGWLVDRHARGRAVPGRARWMLELTDIAMLRPLD